MKNFQKKEGWGKNQGFFFSFLRRSFALIIAEDVGDEADVRFVVVDVVSDEGQGVEEVGGGEMEEEGIENVLSIQTFQRKSGPTRQKWL